MIYSTMLNTSVGLHSIYIAIYCPEELPKELRKKIKSLTVVVIENNPFPEKCNIIHTVKYLSVSSRYLQGSFPDIFLITYF